MILFALFTVKNDSAIPSNVNSLPVKTTVKSLGPNLER